MYIISLGDENPCQGEELKCASNAVCVPTETSYRCICKEGFEGDGQNCYGILKLDICMYVHTYVCVCMYLCVYVCIHTFMYIMYICICKFSQYVKY